MSKPTVGSYLIHRMHQAGLRHIFGIPGDYILGFYDMLVDSPIQIIGTCTEIGAGFAADAYARVHGLGATCVTYCVGGFNLLNAVAGAYAEKSPLIVISGAPGLGERHHSALLHHKVRDFGTSRQIFERVTVAAEAIEDPATAPRQIDWCIEACVRQKRPVYIELPRDIVGRPCAPPGKLDLDEFPGDPKALREAVDEAVAMIRLARRPVILAGVEVHRFGLQPLLLDLVARSKFPVAATLLGKSVISELHPQYVGVYEGAMGHESTRKVVEGSDCVVILGAFMTDINLGIYTANLDESRTINATSEKVTIKRHHYEGLSLRAFIEALTHHKLGRHRSHAAPVPTPKPILPKRDAPVTVRRFWRRMNDFLDPNSVVIADIGDSLFGAADLTIHRGTEFISPAYYTSMGFAVPAAIGAQVRPLSHGRRLRPIVFVGDGAFQMTGPELSTAARYGLNPIVFVLNNKGFTTERFIRDGPYNDVHEWAYHLFPQVLRRGWGAEVHTEGELESTLIQAKGNTQSFSLINVQLAPLDRSDALDRLGKRLSVRAKPK